MAHLSNPLATTRQLLSRTASNSLPPELQDCIRFYTARLTQAAGILLQLPQDITAQAIVILHRYWLVDDIMSHEFSDVSAASIYLIAKMSASPRSLRSISNVYAYLLSTSSTLNSRIPSDTKPDPETYYLTESEYISNRTRILHVEGQILNAIGFNTHVALPHPLAITYLQTLDIFTPSSAISSKKATETAKKAIEYLNTALLSPQMLYLTHQPSSLATAAIYIAAREVGVKMPDCEWWEVFDTDREELGFLVVGMRSLEGLVGSFGERGWLRKGWVERYDIRQAVKKARGGMDEEDEMMMLLDEKITGDG